MKNRFQFENFKNLIHDSIVGEIKSLDAMLYDVE